METMIQANLNLKGVTPALKACPPFQALKDEHFSQILKIGEHLRFASAEVIVEEGSDTEAFFVIVEGDAAIRLKGPAFAKRDACSPNSNDEASRFLFAYPQARYTSAFTLTTMKQDFRDAMARLESEHWWCKARREILETAVERLAGDSKLALTVGVGFTKEAEILSRCPRLVAIDLAPINPYCREISLPAQADATVLPFKSGSFDAVFIFDVLEHIDADTRVLEELHRVLCPMGKLLVTVPAFQFLFGLQDEESDHKRRYRKDSLKELVRGTGFEIDYATYFNTLLFPFIAAVRLFRRVFPANAEAGKSDFDMRLPGSIEAVLEKIFSFDRHAIDRTSLPFGISILCSERRV